MSRRRNSSSGAGVSVLDLTTAIKANPKDAAARLALANKYDSLGKPELGELIRIECQLNGLLQLPAADTTTVAADSEDLVKMATQINNTINANNALRAELLGPINNVGHVIIHRGVPEEWHVTDTDFNRIATDAFKYMPILRVKLLLTERSAAIEALKKAELENLISLTIDMNSVNIWDPNLTVGIVWPNLKILEIAANAPLPVEYQKEDNLFYQLDQTVTPNLNALRFNVSNSSVADPNLNYLFSSNNAARITEKVKALSINAAVNEQAFGHIRRLIKTNGLQYIGIDSSSNVVDFFAEYLHLPNGNGGNHVIQNARIGKIQAMSNALSAMLNGVRTGIKHFCIDEIVEHNLASIVKTMAVNSNVETAMIYGRTISDEVMTSIGSSSRFSNIKTLVLGDTGATSAGVFNLLNPGKLANLEYLMIGGDHIAKDEAENLMRKCQIEGKTPALRKGIIAPASSDTTAVPSMIEETDMYAIGKHSSWYDKIGSKYFDHKSY